MKIKLNYWLIPLIVISVASLGSWVTFGGMPWYQTLRLPTLAPAGSLIGLVWTVIFILATISALLFWNRQSDNKNSALIIGLFITNAILNLVWSILFFGLYLIGWSIVEMILLNATTIALIIALWRKYRVSAILLIPYFIWVSFATYLAIAIWQLNH